jgi:protein O-mannosyl-transferase
LTDKKKNKEIKKSKPQKQVVAKQRSGISLVYACIAIITIVTYFVFSPSLDDGFTNWDDQVYVQQNPLVVNNSVPLVKIFETPVLLNYHPITILTLALNYQTGKLNPSGYHFENVIFHLLNTILVFLFIFLLTRRNLLMAAIVSLFFGIHPMHVESVAWISERKDVLYVFFLLAALISYLRYSETKKKGWYIFTFLLFMLSCLSKGMAVVFPIILLLIDYLRGVKWERRLLFEKIPFFLLSLVFGIVAVMAQAGKSIASMQVFTLFQRLMFVSYGAVMYIVKLFLPIKLSSFYPYPDTTAGNGIPLIFYLSPFILLAIIGALVYFFRKKQKEMVFGLLFYFVSVVLVLQLVSVGLTIMADRYSYLAYIGLLFIVAYIINKAWQSKSGVWAALKYPFILIAIIGASLFSVQTYSRTQVWKNSETLWTDVIDNYPTASMAYYNRGHYYYDAGEMEKAMPDFIKSIKLDSTYADVYVDRGNIYNDYGKINSALNDFNRAIALNPTGAQAYNNRGLLYLNNGKAGLSIADFNKAIALSPDSALYYYNRGLYYKNVNQYEKAVDDLTTGIQLNPQNVELYYNMRGICNIYLQNYKEAAADFSNAIELNPSVAGYWLNRSFAESKTGADDMAKADALKGQQLQGK